MGITDTNSAGTYASFTYARDSANQVTSEVVAGSSFPSAPTQSNTYDSVERVCSQSTTGSAACGAGTQPYAYDNANQPTTMSVGSTGSPSTHAQAFNTGATNGSSQNQLCWSYTGTSTAACGSPPTGTSTNPLTTYTYDSRFNRIGSATTPAGTATSAAFDLQNRMCWYSTAAFTNGCGTAPTGASTYQYDASNLRYSKVSGGVTTHFVWDMTGGTPNLLKEIVGGTSNYYLYAGGVAVEQIVGSTAYFLHHDQLGSTRAVTDATGAVQSAYTYDAYGNLVKGTQGSMPLLFAGQYRDSESGLYYMRARYYDSVSGEFTSMDSLVSATRSAYGYVGGNPVNGSDPSGQFCLQFWDSSKCDNPATTIVKAVSSPGPHTVGTCLTLNASWWGAAGAAHLCAIVAFNKNWQPKGFGTTESVDAGAATGPGVSGLLGIQISNAKTIQALGGVFATTSATGGDGWVGGASGAVGFDKKCPVFVGEANLGLGIYAPVPGAGTVGASQTWAQTWVGQ